ncbi:MAG: ABC-F family ATP-binding cassette domain-containing protein [Anaerolineae bacterium]
MSILNITNLSQSFGAFTVFSGLSASVPHGAKIGLVGPNGIGKTSLLLILCKLAQASSGSVHVAQGTRIGYLRQEAMEAFAQRENTVYEEMMTVFAGVQDMEAKMRELEERMAEDYSDALLEEYGAVQEAFEHIGGYDYELRIQQTLEGLGFPKELYEMPLTRLSGGQKTRALLARLLLERPDLLILDEPTNHLDVDAVEWLETTLRNWNGALLIVSHDRYFLDAVVNTIWEMSRTGIETYRGNYSAYVKQRQERWERQDEVYQQEMERLAKEIDYVKRNIVRASTNALAVGRLRRLSRDLIAIQEVGLMAYRESKSWLQLGVGAVRPLGVMEAEQAIKEIESPNIRPPKLNLRLKSTLRSGDLVLRTRNLDVGYPEKFLFSADDITLTRGECAALIGPNGTGKTTFLKTIMGELEALGGRTMLGSSLRVGYFAQAHGDMQLDNSVIDELIRHKNMLPGEARNHLAMFLFRKDDVFKKVSMLSGGERAKLAMAILALQGANFLLLDEPTNHLDIPAQEVLQEVLENFDGTILLVSHDRYLVDRLATQIWSLENEHLQVFKGNYQEFLAARETDRQKAKEARAAAKQEQKVMANGKRSMNGNQRKQGESMAKLELQIAQMEIALQRIGKGLQIAGKKQDNHDIQRLSHEYSTTQAQLDELMNQWTVLAGE